MKVGSGYLSEKRDNYTVPGKIYHRVPEWKAGEKGWLVCIRSKLYYRSPSVDPNALLILDAHTLKEIGRVVPSTSKHSKGGIFAEKTSSISFGRSPLCSDGRYLYIVSKKKSKKFGTWKVSSFEKRLLMFSSFEWINMIHI
jgi:hypothetical protein